MTFKSKYIKIRQKRLLRLAQLEANNENKTENNEENASNEIQTPKYEPKKVEPKIQSPIEKPNAFSSLASMNSSSQVYYKNY